MSKNKLNAVSLLLCDSRGIYIPCNFVNEFDLLLWEGITQENIDNLQDAESESYWDTWNDVLCNAEFHDNGNIWRLYQDGDLWALCFELMTDEEKINFGFDLESED